MAVTSAMLVTAILLLVPAAADASPSHAGGAEHAVNAGSRGQRPRSDSTDQGAPWNSGAPCVDTTTVVGAACSLNPILESDFPTQYAGLTISDHDSIINIYLTATPDNFDTVVNQAVPAGTTVTYHSVSNSLLELWNTQKQLMSDDSALQSTGMDINGFYIDIPQNTLVIQLIDGTAEQISSLQQRYGASLVTVESLAPGQGSSPMSIGPSKQNRSGSNTPWVAGGIAILCLLIAVVAGLRLRRTTRSHIDN